MPLSVNNDWFGRYVGMEYLDHGYGEPCAIGVNCWGLVRLIYREVAEIDLPPYDIISAKDLLSVARKITGEKDKGVWQRNKDVWGRFDVIVMTGRSSTVRRATVHCGIAIDQNRMLHTERSVGVVNVRKDNPTVKFRVAGVYRHRDLINADC